MGAPAVDSPAPSLRFPRTRRLRTPADFKRVYAQGRRISNEFFTVNMLPNDLSLARLGDVGGRAHHGRRGRAQSTTPHDSRKLSPASRAAAGARPRHWRAQRGAHHAAAAELRCESRAVVAQAAPCPGLRFEHECGDPLPAACLSAPDLSAARAALPLLSFVLAVRASKPCRCMAVCAAAAWGCGGCCAVIPGTPGAMIPCPAPTHRSTRPKAATSMTANLRVFLWVLLGMAGVHQLSDLDARLSGTVAGDRSSLGRRASGGARQRRADGCARARRHRHEPPAPPLPPLPACRRHQASPTARRMPQRRPGARPYRCTQYRRFAGGRRARSRRPACVSRRPRTRRMCRCDMLNRDSADSLFVLQSGLAGVNGESAPTHQATYTADVSEPLAGARTDGAAAAAALERRSRRQRYEDADFPPRRHTRSAWTTRSTTVAARRGALLPTSRSCVITCRSSAPIFASIATPSKARRSPTAGNSRSSTSPRARSSIRM